MPFLYAADTGLLIWGREIVTNYEAGLYNKSVAAMERYFQTAEKPITEIGRAVDTAKREMYRAGWMIGYRAGKRATQRRRAER